MSIKTALVTGGTGGIGAVIAEKLLDAGCRVIVHGRNSDKVAKTCERFCAAGKLAVPLVGELTDSKSRHDFVFDVRLLNVELDLLVNCAGGGGAHESWSETTEEKWLMCFQLNVMSIVELVRAFVPGMKNRGWGRVINISSVSAHKPLAIGPEYAAAKAAICNLTVSLAKECTKSGVTVNSISPGLCMTPDVRKMVSDMIKRDNSCDQDLDDIATATLFPNIVGQLVRPEEIASLVVWLASDSAARVTGRDFVMDGGYLSM